MNNNWVYPVYYWVPTWQDQRGFANYGCPRCPESCGCGCNDNQYLNEQRNSGDGWNNARDTGLIDDERNNRQEAAQEENENANLREEAVNNQDYKPDDSDVRNQTFESNARTVPEMNQRITIDDAINIARERVRGEVVKVELDTQRHDWVYKVDVITTENTMDEIKVCFNTGEIV
jgi:uncharacterized membrane protein YkoI